MNVNFLPGFALLPVLLEPVWCQTKVHARRFTGMVDDGEVSGSRISSLKFLNIGEAHRDLDASQSSHLSKPSPVFAESSMNSR